MIGRKLFFSLIIISFLVACAKKDVTTVDPPEYVDTTTLISFYNGKLSHNTGKDCQKCHQKGGNGKAWFSVSGTVYDSLMQHVFPNATIRIYDGLDSSSPLVARIAVDSLGNFYSTQKIDFKNGMHVEVAGKKSITKMGSLIRSASCNRCHGITANRIWVK